MRIIIPLAFLCLLITSCQKNSDIIYDTELQSRTSCPMSLIYNSVNGVETKLYCHKIKCKAVSSSNFLIDIYTSTTRYYTVSASNANFYNENGYTNFTNEKGENHFEIMYASILPYSANQVRLYDSSIELDNSNSFVGEEGDGF